MARPKFELAFLHPRHWLTWFGLGILWLLVQLPYPFLFWFGSALGRTSQRFLQRRATIANRNIELCFPGMDTQQRKALIEKNFASLGMALLETGMAWFWSDRRVRKWFDVEGYHYLLEAQRKQKGVMVVGVHFMSLELGGRVMGLCQPMMATYRPHNSPVMEWVQTRGRLRSNKSMIDRHNLKGLVNALKGGEAVWFAPDQDYGPKGSTFAPFFSVENAATTNGTYVISRLSGAEMLTISMVRKDNARGYALHIGQKMEDFPRANEYEAASYINKMIEHEILRAPEQYLWIHRRFKTRPTGEASLYV